MVNALDETIQRHTTTTIRPLLNSGEYEHATAGTSSNSITFTPLHYRPSAYPEIDLDDFDGYTFDDGTEHKFWSIKEVSNNKAHVFYQNNHTNQRLVHQLVDLNLSSIKARITKKLSEGYTIDRMQSDFRATDRTMIEQIPF